MIAAAMVLAAIQAGAPTCRTSDSRVEALISAKAVDLKGDEYCQFRLYNTIHDVDHDGIDDFIVVFAVEGIGGGGGHAEQYLALFSSTVGWQPSVIKVGQRGVRIVTEIEVDKGVIVLTTLEQQRGDALCCPSAAGKARFEFKNGTLREVQPGSPKR